MQCHAVSFRPQYLKDLTIIIRRKNMMSVLPVWKRLTRWPENPLRSFGLNQQTADFCKILYEQHRLRLDVLDKGGGERELAIPCRRGCSVGGISQLCPADEGYWVWMGAGGFWANKMIELLGEGATSPSGEKLSAAEAGTKFDEIVIRFPQEKFFEVARLLGARRRRSASTRAA
jgi:hypothetical protein